MLDTFLSSLSLYELAFTQIIFLACLRFITISLLQRFENISNSLSVGLIYLCNIAFIWHHAQTSGFLSIFLYVIFLILVTACILDWIFTPLKITYAIILVFLGGSLLIYDQWYTWDQREYACRAPLCEPKERIICTQETKPVEGFRLVREKEQCYTELTKRLWSYSHTQYGVGIPGFNAGYELPTTICLDRKGEWEDCENQKIGLIMQSQQSY